MEARNFKSPGGTKKVCLPLAKIRGMSASEKSKIIRAKRKAGAAGKYKRSSKSNTTGTSSGGSLKNWVKQDWRQVANPHLKCGEKAPGEKKAPTKMEFTVTESKQYKKQKRKEPKPKVTVEKRKLKREFKDQTSAWLPNDSYKIKRKEVTQKRADRMTSRKNSNWRQLVYGSPLTKAEPRRTIGRGKNFNKANDSGTGAAAGGGMTQKGVDAYKRKNPGSKLKTAVTTDPKKLKKGSKAWKRRKSFCARSKKWKSKRGRAARRRWNC